MPDYTDQDSVYAGQLVDSFLSRERRAADLPSNLVVSDVEADAVGFANEMDFLDDVGAPAQALRATGGARIPMALSEFFEAPPTARAFGDRLSPRSRRSATHEELWLAACHRTLQAITSICRPRDLERLRNVASLATTKQ